ncbi:MAG TPA: hypothetical protein VND80_12460 [Steroidobacteraceae bacterium]|nr:hypothetical protein [Steroidobacteraceae bacterium]
MRGPTVLAGLGFELTGAFGRDFAPGDFGVADFAAGFCFAFTVTLETAGLAVGFARGCVVFLGAAAFVTAFLGAVLAGFFAALVRFFEGIGVYAS